MSSEAAEFLDAWTVAREDKAPLTRAEAEALAAEWEADADDNGIAPADIDAAAGGNLADYLLRVFGQAGHEGTFAGPPG